MGLRTWLSMVVVATLLFSRLAVAAYACAELAPPAVDMAVMPCAEMMAQGQPLDPMQALLCQQHCQWGQGEQSGAGAALAAAPLAPAPVWALWPAAVHDLAAQGPASALLQPLQQAPPVPLRTALCCLRP